MEHLEFELAGGSKRPVRDTVLVGAVGSGNLEVLVERAELGGRCRVSVDTAIEGYAQLWRRVVADAVTRSGLADAHVSVNDGGATPAVVSLRLDQAAAEATAEERR